MNEVESLIRVFVELHPEDAAKAAENIHKDELVRLFKKLPDRAAVPLAERLSPHVMAAVLEASDEGRRNELLRSLEPRIGASILQHVDETKREEIIGGLPDSNARQLRQFSEYLPETAGSMMEPRVASLHLDLTAQQAILAIRKAPRRALHYLYVTKRGGELAGVINMRDLLLANPRDPIEPFVRREVLAIPANMERSDVVALMRERRFLALPVVDMDGKLIGVVKHDEALQAGQLEAFQDLQKMVGAGSDERALSPVSTVVKSRLPWLYVNLVTAFMAAAVVGMFEGIIAQMAALAVLLPVVAGQGGNTGSQSLAVVMRGLALREIMPGSKRRVVMKELLGGVINGVAVAVVTAAAVFAWRMMKGDTAEVCSGLALVIGLAMVINMAAAALSGAIIPLALKALGRDPAQSAAIFLTTVTDIVGFAAFLGFAVLFKDMLT